MTAISRLHKDLDDLYTRLKWNEERQDEIQYESENLKEDAKDLLEKIQDINEAIDFLKEKRLTNIKEASIIE